MAVAVSYPGVYIQEVPSGSRAIAGVPTSVAAFVGFTGRGELGSPVQCFSFADYERNFGGLRVDSAVSFAVAHFFLNGGATCWVVPAADDSGTASAAVFATTNSDIDLTVTARSEGEWGDELRASIDFATADPAAQFNLVIDEVAERNGRQVAVRTETHRNLSMDPEAARFVLDVVNADSTLVSVSIGDPVPVDVADASPIPGGTVGGAIADFASLDFTAPLGDMTAQLGEVTVDITIAPDVADLTAAALAIETALNAGAEVELAEATVAVVGTAPGPEFLLITPGGGDATQVISFEGSAAELLLLDEANASVYPRARIPLMGGADAAALAAGAFAAASRAEKAGFYALEDVRLFNILNLPGVSEVSDLSAAIAYAEERRSMILLDLPEATNTFDEARDWITDEVGSLRHRNAVAYWPRPHLANPLRDNRLEPFPSSGLIAGLVGAHRCHAWCLEGSGRDRCPAPGCTSTRL